MGGVTGHIALDGHRSVVRRLELLAGTGGTEVRRGEGWFAVTSGVASNDLNGVVSAVGAALDEALVDELLVWLGERGGPASWMFADVVDPRVLDWLLERGGRPERTGNWAGRSLDLGVAGVSRGVTVEPVGDGAALGRWLDVAEACGWIEGPVDRAARRRLALAVGLDHPKWTRWVATLDGGTVGMGSSFPSGEVVEVVDVAVLEAARRRGVGRALLIHQLGTAVTAGAARAVLAPSPDGWLLARSVGFRLAPVVPDVCCYLPSPDA
jgi:GNAT superfamily N-acetyltransferase